MSKFEPTGNQFQSVHDLICYLQTHLKVTKERTNNYSSSQFAYRNTSDIIEALKPFMIEIGFRIKLDEEIVNAGGKNYIKSTATIYFRGESESSCGWAGEEATKKGMDSGQITGSATSYARKMALGGLLAIDDGFDADAYTEEKEAVKATEAEARSNLDALMTAGESVAKSSGEKALGEWWNSLNKDDRKLIGAVNLNKLKGTCKDE